MPEWAVVIMLATVWITGFAVGILVPRRRKITEVDRTEKKEVRPLNVFDAYSDKEMQDQRTEVANRVKYNRKHDFPTWLANSIEELRKIDDEIQARKNTKLALEETKRTEHERDIAIFDTVYSEVLKRSEIES